METVVPPNVVGQFGELALAVLVASFAPNSVKAETNAPWATGPPSKEADETCKELFATPPGMHLEPDCHPPPAHAIAAFGNWNETREYRDFAPM